MYRPVCVGPVRKPHCWFFHEAAQIRIIFSINIGLIKRTVNDLIDSNGNIYTFEGLKERYKIRGTFLDYGAFIRKIPRAWQEKINANTDICINEV